MGNLAWEKNSVRQGEAGLELGVFGDGGYVTTKVNRELGGGRVETSNTVLLWETAVGEIASCSCVVGGELEEGGYGKVTYMGGSRKCIVVKKGMGPEEGRRMVTEITGSDLSKHKLWYSLKCDWKISMTIEKGCGCEDIFLGRDVTRTNKFASSSTQSLQVEWLQVTFHVRPTEATS
ncbi:hypothetical protein Cgig2_019814 [Carnegiea gigantea]|uniref:Uncharacterized protein n=1 Tax=Carnegiea gigantea TaxID=171969 RepID=A0A9Q1GHH1_9CARY|nr:hypothetical protein Cgig2_019814 [Carnegiea gigantea]